MSNKLVNKENLNNHFQFLINNTLKKYVHLVNNTVNTHINYGILVIFFFYHYDQTTLIHTNKNGELVSNIYVYIYVYFCVHENPRKICVWLQKLKPKLNMCVFILMWVFVYCPEWALMQKR